MKNKKKLNRVNKTVVDNRTPEQKEETRKNFIRVMGFFMGLWSKHLLEEGGCHVTYMINGELITDIEKLHGLEISKRIQLAIKEERYEDAANLKKMLDSKTQKP